MILNIMEVVEEENPLQICTEAQVALNYKNNVGRPTKKSEIKFSPQPKSLISILLSKEKPKKDCTIFINKLIGKSVKQKDSLYGDSLERALYNKPDYNVQNVVYQRNQLYECNHLNCTYSTKFLSNLKAHKRIHTPEQQYICDECTFRSKFISSLKTHKRLHRDERPFTCQHCEYKCNSRSNLKKHITRKHTKINSDK